MILIINQNKETLFIDNVVYYINTLQNSGEFAIFCNNGCDENAEQLCAKYSSKEKALKVLDMLERTIINLGRCSITPFGFPKDNEVEI